LPKSDTDGDVYSNRDGNCDIYSDGYRHSYGDGNCHVYSDSYGYRNRDSNCHGYRDGDIDSNCNRTTFTVSDLCAIE